MSTITTLLDWITGLLFRTTVNDNFTALNTDKAEKSGGTFTWDISVPAEVYGAGWNGSNEVPTKNDLYDKIETLGGSTTLDGLTDVDITTPANGEIIAYNSTSTKWENVPLSGGGDMLASTYDPAGWARQVAFEDSTQETLVSGSNIKTINWTNILWSWNLEITAGSGWYASNVYLTNLTSSIVWSYKQTSYTNDAAETLVSTVTNNNEVLAWTYLFDTPVWITTIDAWVWTFRPNIYVSSAVGTTKIRIETFKRTSWWVETTLFSSSSSEIDNTTTELHTFESIQPQFLVNATDYLWTRIYVNTTAVINITVTYVVWDGNASYFNTPLALRHNQLRARDTVDSHPASAITNTPAWNIASTTVQWAINELDTEKALLAGSISQAFAVSQLEVWHASDTTITRVSAGVIAVEWQTIAKVSDVTNKLETIALAISDETTAITTWTAKITFRMPYAFTVTAVKASLTTASSSGIPTFDINESGTTILSTKLTIDATELTSATATTAAVISDSALASDAEITIDIDVAGTGAKGAKIYIIGHQ